MLTTVRRIPSGREVGEPSVRVSDQVLRVAEDAVVFWGPPHTHGPEGYSWTSGTGEMPASEPEASEQSMSARRVALAGNRVLFAPGMSVRRDTSNAARASELGRHLAILGARRIRSKIAKGVVAMLRPDETTLELLEKLRRPASINHQLASRQRALLTRAGGALDAIEVAQRLNVSLEEVDDLRDAGRLMAVPGPDSEDWVYPACQFEGPRVVPGLTEVLSDFAVKSPWTQLYVMISEDPALSGRNPIEALKEGDLDVVREIVGGYGEQGGA